MGRWFVSPGVTVDKLAGRLTPVGFTGPHVRALRDVLVWIGQGAPTDHAEAPAVGAVPGDYDDPSDAEERSRIDQLIADQLDGGDESGSEASLESDDDDEYSSSSESGEDGYELAEDDEKEELAHVEEKMQQVKLPVGEAMRMLAEKSDALLHRLLRLTLRHMLKQTLTPAEMDKLEHHAVDEIVGLDELPRCAHMSWKNEGDISVMHAFVCCGMQPSATPACPTLARGDAG